MDRAHRTSWMLLALLSAAPVPASGPPAPSPSPSPSPTPSPSPPPSPRLVPPPRTAEAPLPPAGEVIIIVGDGPRGGPGDLVGDAPAARDGRRALATAPFVSIIHVDE